MREVSRKGFRSIWVFVGLLTACTSLSTEPTQIAPAVANVNSTIEYTATPQVEPTLTETWTVEPTETSTASPTTTKTATASPLPTATTTATPTRTLAPLSTPTFTPSPRPEAPRFPETSLGPFDANNFRRELQELVTFQSDFLSYFRRVAAGEQGGCRRFYQYRNELIVSQEAYFDVPDEWYSLYYQYRVIILEAVNNVQPITAVCDVGGGDVPPETDQVIIANLEAHIAWAEQLIAAAAVIP